MDAGGKQIMPNDGSTGLEISASSGCRKVKLPPGSYYVGGQKVINPAKGIYISGSANFDVTLGSSIEVKIELAEIK